MTASASCTWGDGPAVLVVIGRDSIDAFALCDHGDGHSSFGLTAVGARALAAELLASADRADELAIAAARPPRTFEEIRAAVEACGPLPSVLASSEPYPKGAKR